MTVSASPQTTHASDTESSSAPAPERPMQPLPERWTSLQRAFVETARRQPNKTAMIDSTGASLTYRQTLLRSLALMRVLERSIGDDEHCVGLWLPPMVPSAVANLAVALLGRTQVNLNYTASQEAIDSAIAQAEIRHVITAQKALDRFEVKPKATPLLLEELAKQVTWADKLWALAASTILPIGLLTSLVPGLRRSMRDDVALMIFTSGSTGEPKGVMLTHCNILCNIHSFQQQLRLEPDEILLGILPFFHSFGTTVTLWASLCLGKTAVYHFNPTDARVVGRLCQEHRVTLVLGAPTFLRTYLRRCTPEQFATVKRFVAGAEKLKPELRQELTETFDLTVLEGYGCTETAPVVAVNVDDPLTTADGRSIPGNRPGSVGMPIPGTAIRILDPETGAELPRGRDHQGLIHVAGPQIMRGYLKQQEKTDEVLRGGWYNTGDLGAYDEDGFLWVMDRLSRFSKIAGEMVPHVRVESALLQVTGRSELELAVSGIPDTRRGERLVVLYSDLGGMSPDRVIEALQQSALPPLWIPARGDFLAVDRIPMLGTGKLDLKAIKGLARQLAIPAGSGPNPVTPTAGKTNQ